MYKIFDTHNDYFTTLKFNWSKQKYINKSINVAQHIITAVWTSKMKPNLALETINNASAFISSNENLSLAIEDLHFLTKQNMFEIINNQSKYCSLTWNYNNILAGGALDNGDITNFGKDVIKLFENNDIFIDTAHLNEKSFMTLSNLTTKPMLCSHTASYEMNAHKRNLKDYQIKIITESGGLVSFALVSDFLCGKHKSTIDDFVNHVDYCVNKFGIDYFAIGTDFYGTKHLPKNIKNYQSLEKLLLKKLTKRGYTFDDISKLFYQNAYNFFEK